MILVFLEDPTVLLACSGDLANGPGSGGLMRLGIWATWQHQVDLLSQLSIQAVISTSDS